MADVPRPAGAPQGGAGWQVGDIVVKTTTRLTTTGGTVWGAAHRAIGFLEACREQLGLERPGIRILELGAGCGLLGLTLARNLPQAGEICLTEQAFGGALDHLRENVDANRAAGTPGAPAVTTAACDWTQALSGGAGDGGAGDGGAAGGGALEAGSAGGEGQEERCADTARLMSSRWDLILGSDLVYNEAGTHLLPRVMRALALAGRAPPPHAPPAAEQPAQDGKARPAPGVAEEVVAAPIYYAHTKHRYDICDVLFMEQCAAAGLEVEEMWEPGAPRPPPSPPPLTELFPEMRCAVYKITVRRQQACGG